MQFYARIQSLIELVEQVYESNTPADVIINNYMRQRRYIGSGDRRDIAERFFHILRHYWQFQGYLTAAGFGGKTPFNLGRLHVLIYLTKHLELSDLSDLLNGEPFAPPPLTTIEQLLVDKIRPIPLSALTEAARLGVSESALVRYKESFPETYEEEIGYHNEPGPLVLRVNTLKTTPEDVLKMLRAEEIDGELTAYSPWGIRLTKKLPLANHPLFKKGWFEVQEEGSQLICQMTNVQPGMTVWDYCAGAGGKTLALAAMMKNRGHIIATDVVDWRLKKAPERFKRAGVHNVECRILEGEGDKAASPKWLKRQQRKYDRVLVDAPCSGSGTWRRNPELKWRIQDQELEEICQKQAEILERASLLVKPGGHLIYATCSVYGQENYHQIEKFLANHSEFKALSLTLEALEFRKTQGLSETTLSKGYLQLSPAQHGTDGFFVCILRKNSL